MHLRADPRPSSRPADNDLYDRGSDLVAAAQAIRRCAADPDAVRAIPALIGCVETTLDELGTACHELERTSIRTVGGHGGRRMPELADRMRRGLANLAVALGDAEDASRAARALAGRCLAATAESAVPRPAVRGASTRGRLRP
jgi:hypothetical protein